MTTPKPVLLKCLGRELHLCTENEVPEGADPRKYVEDPDHLTWYELPGTRSGFSVTVSFECYEEENAYGEPLENEGMWHIYVRHCENNISVEVHGHDWASTEARVAQALKGQIALYTALLALVEEASGTDGSS